MENRNWLERTEMVLGNEALKKLQSSKVLIFGVGGVGGFVCEALVRAGVGEIHIVDGDTISETNLNRQIIATIDTIGRDKVAVMEERIKSINPKCKVISHKSFILPGDFGEVKEFEYFDFIVDAIDTVAGKLAIIQRAKERDRRIISSMGTGNKMDPSQFVIDDISKTSICPLARVIRKSLKEKNIQGVDVLYSKEEPVKTRNRTPGSVSFVPSVAGLLIGGFVVRELIGK